MYSNIEAERARLGLTKKELAKKLELTLPTLNSYINDGNIPLKILREMKTLFNRSIDYLIDN